MNPLMEWLLIVLLTLAGASRAVSDALAHGSTRLAARGPWWDNATSWTRKYKDYYGGDKRPRYFGATTFLVAFSDAWHCSNFLTWLFADTAFLIAAFPAFHWYAVAAVVARRVVFQPAYSFLRKS